MATKGLFTLTHAFIITQGAACGRRTEALPFGSPLDQIIIVKGGKETRRSRLGGRGRLRTLTAPNMHNTLAFWAFSVGCAIFPCTAQRWCDICTHHGSLLGFVAHAGPHRPKRSPRSRLGGVDSTSIPQKFEAVADHVDRTRRWCPGGACPFRAPVEIMKG